MNFTVKTYLLLAGLAALAAILLWSIQNDWKRFKKQPLSKITRRDILLAAVALAASFTIWYLSR